MSLARVTFVNTARKAQGTCGKCGVEIPAGSKYCWWIVGFRSSYKRVRCGLCGMPPASERESNSSMQIVYEAQESMEAALKEAKSLDDIKGAVEDAAERVREAIEDWEEKKSNLESGFPNGCPQIEEIDEHISNAESLADALESFEPSEPHEDDEEVLKFEEARVEAQSCWDDNNPF